MMVVRPTSQTTASARSTAMREWLPVLVALGCAALVFGAAFWTEVSRAVRVWIDSTAYNHCFLVLPLVGYLLWERRSVILAALPRPALWPALLIIPLAAVWLAAAVLDILEGRQLAMVGMFELTVLAALGPQLFRRLLAPLLFLFFLVPFGGFLVPSLQRVTAEIAVAGLQALHIPVFSDGLMIEIPEGTFEIAEACAGLRFLIAAIVFGCFFGVVMYRSWPRRAVFIALSVVVPIAANGVRALGIVVLAHLLGSAAAAETDHILYGWIFFTIVIMVLIVIGMAFAEKDRAAAEPATAPASTPSAWRVALAVAVAVMAAATGPAYAAWLDRDAARGPIAGLPAVAPPWQLRADLPLSWHPDVSGADRVLLGTYEAPGVGQVIRYVGLYRLRAIGNRLTASDNRVADEHQWTTVRRFRTEAAIAGQRVPMAATILASGVQRRLVWSFFLVDGTITDRLLAAKLLQARAALVSHAPLAALVIVSTSIDDSPDRVAERLARFVAASGPLAADVAGPTDRR